MSLTRSSRLAAIGLLAIAMGAGSAYAADDGYDNVLSSVATAVGLMSPDEAPEIEYRERAPLVLPPKMDLVKPVAAGTGRPSSWPQDPDVIRRRKAAEEGRAPAPNLLGNEKVVMSKDELMKGRVDGDPSNQIPESSRRAAKCGNNGNNRACLVVSSEQLEAEAAHYAAMKGPEAKEELAPGDEPERMWLTQPPKGYFKVTKVVKATNDGPKRRIDMSNPNADLLYKEKTDE